MWKNLLNLWLFAGITMIFIGVMGQNPIFIFLGVISILLSFGNIKKEDNDKNQIKD